MGPSRQLPGRFGRGFTIIELLVTMAVLSILVLVLTTVTDSSFKLWRSTQASISMFGAARNAYDIMGRRLAQATTNTYLDYYDASWNRRDPNSVTFVPAKYGRASDLHFLCGTASTLLGGNATATTHPGHGVFFFAPLGFTDGDASYADLPNLLNPMGYYVEFGSDQTLRPPLLAPLSVKHRFRLIENIQPTQQFTGYPQFTDIDPANDFNWLRTGLAASTAGKNPLADNIIALIIRPEMAEQDARGVFGSSGQAWNLTSNYQYDSRSGASRPAVTVADPRALQFAQLPPMLRVVMVAVDENAVRRLTGAATSPPTALQLNASWFTNPANLNQDLAALSTQLVNADVPFRIFNQVIPLRGAKFSTQREN